MGLKNSGYSQLYVKMKEAIEKADTERMVMPAADILLSLRDRVRQASTSLGQIFYGMTIYEMVRDLQKERSAINRLFVLVVFGDLLGLPILPPYYTLRLLPYIVKDLEGWRRSMLRERDFTDLCDQEIA